MTSMSVDVSDRLALMDGGRLIQMGTGREIYDDPVDEFVAAFLGDPLLVAGDVARISHRAPLGVAGFASLRMWPGPATLSFDPSSCDCFRPMPTPLWDAPFVRVVFAALRRTGLTRQVALDAGVTVTVHDMRDHGPPATEMTRLWLGTWASRNPRTKKVCCTRRSRSQAPSPHRVFGASSMS
jgi:ABC-type sulfate/molybdate transport systems ATPase subunit